MPFLKEEVIFLSSPQKCFLRTVDGNQLWIWKVSNFGHYEYYELRLASENFENIGEQVPFNIEVGGGDFIPEPCRIFVGFTFSFIFLHFLNPLELARGGFRLTDPKNVLKAPLAPKSNNFEGEARAEKAQFFWPEFSKKCLKAPFWDCFFFQNFACGAKYMAKAVFVF